MSYKIELSEKELTEIKARQKKEKSIKIFQRLQCIQMVNQGVKKQNIADFLNITTNTVTTWVKLYKKGGIDFLTQLNYDDRRQIKLDTYREAIIDYVKEELPDTISQILAWLDEEHLFKTEHSWLYRYMKKNSIFLIKRQR